MRAAVGRVGAWVRAWQDELAVYGCLVAGVVAVGVLALV